MENNDILAADADAEFDVRYRNAADPKHAVRKSDGSYEPIEQEDTPLLSQSLHDEAERRLGSREAEGEPNNDWAFENDFDGKSRWETPSVEIFLIRA